MELRKEIGMVFQKPNPFPMSVYDNVAYGPRIHGIERQRRSGRDRGTQPEECRALGRAEGPAARFGAEPLRRPAAAPLHRPRCLAVEPDVLLMDEPCSALDPIATAKIEDLMRTLKEKYTIVIVTHNMQQAARVSDRTAFFLMGDLIEYEATKKLFENPSNKRTEDYITGRFG